MDVAGEERASVFIPWGFGNGSSADVGRLDYSQTNPGSPPFLHISQRIITSDPGLEIHGEGSVVPADSRIRIYQARVQGAADTGGASFYTGAPGAVGLGAGSLGAATTTARGDHTHPLSTALRDLIDSKLGEGQKWPGDVFVIPHEVHAGIGAFTMRVVLTRAAGTFPNGARMRIAAGTRNGAFVHAADDINSPAILAFDATQSRALIQNTNNGLIGGTLFLDVYQSDESTRIVRIPLRVPVVQGSVGPLITNIASYDATQDRFEDSTGGAIALPAGAIVLTTQAIYDAAAADSFSFPANVIFLTR